MHMVENSPISSDLSKMDVQSIEQALRNLSNDRDLLLQYISNPDGHMAKVLPSTTMDGVHFHAMIDGERFPEDKPELIDRIELSIVVWVPGEWKSEVLRVAATVKPPFPDPRPPWDPCKGCRRCAIAVIGWK